MHRQPAAIDLLVCLRLRKALLLHQILFELIGQRIDKIRSKTCRYFIVHDLDPVIHLILHRLFVLLFGNVTLIEHILQHLRPPLGIFIGIADRVVPGRILRNARDHRRLRECQVRYGFVEIPLACRLHSERVLPEIDGIQIVFENFFLGSDLFQLDGKVLLLDLAIDPVPLGLIRPVREIIILEKLLGNRRRAL